MSGLIGQALARAVVVTLMGAAVASSAGCGLLVSVPSRIYEAVRPTPAGPDPSLDAVRLDLLRRGRERVRLLLGRSAGNHALRDPLTVAWDLDRGDPVQARATIEAELIRLEGIVLAEDRAAQQAAPPLGPRPKAGRPPPPSLLFDAAYLRGAGPGQLARARDELTQVLDELDAEDVEAGLPRDVVGLHAELAVLEAGLARFGLDGARATQPEDACARATALLTCDLEEELARHGDRLARDRIDPALEAGAIALDTLGPALAPPERGRLVRALTGWADVRARGLLFGRGVEVTTPLERLQAAATVAMVGSALGLHPRAAPLLSIARSVFATHRARASAEALREGPGGLLRLARAASWVERLAGSLAARGTLDDVARFVTLLDELWTPQTALGPEPAFALRQLGLLFARRSGDRVSPWNQTAVAALAEWLLEMGSARELALYGAAPAQLARALRPPGTPRSLARWRALQPRAVWLPSLRRAVWRATWRRGGATLVFALPAPEGASARHLTLYRGGEQRARWTSQAP